VAAKPLFVVTPELEECLLWETLLADVSARFVEVPADRIEQQLSLQKSAN
jgi:hypothetical protein